MGDNADWLLYCQVGSGSTAPAVGDTSLVSRISGASNLISSSLSDQSSAPYYVARTRTYRFLAGVAAGNLAEVGVGWLSTGGLFSRALILDGLGNPTTITVLSDELLDVTYQFRQYAPSVDWAGNITLRSISHDVVSRALAVNVAAASAGELGWSILGGGASAGQSSLSITTAYTGSIGSVTATAPSGTAMASTSVTAAAYSASSLHRDISVLFGNSDGNNASGIGAIRARLGIGMYQFGFTPNIMKTSDDTLSLTFRHSWSRKTL